MPLPRATWTSTDDLTITGADWVTTIIDGGALDRVFHINSGSTVEISGVTARNGAVTTSINSGGGILNQGTLTLTDVMVTENTAGGGGGPRGGGILSTDSLTLIDSTVSLNSAGDGGGIAGYGTITLTNSIVSGNSAGAGGGIFIQESLILGSSVVTGNAASDGGGIYNSFGTVTVTDSSISDNTAGGGRGGGGIFNGGELTLVRSSVMNNSSARSGGGIYHTSATGALTVDTSTLSGNSAFAVGGAIYNAFGTVTLTNATVAENSGSIGGGIYGTVNLKNTIVANSISGGDFGGAGVTSLGYNLDSDGTGGLSNPGDISGVDPLLGPLQDNGGPTFTHALLQGSLAIDAGDNTGAPASDQRGIARPQDGDGDSTATTDIGAYEYVPPATGQAHDYALLATAPGTVRVGKRATVSGGLIGGNGDVKMGTHSVASDSDIVAGGDVLVGKWASTGDITAAGTCTVKKGASTGTIAEGESVPLISLPAVNADPDVGNDIKRTSTDVRAGPLTLTPGRYGKLDSGKGDHIILQGGEYDFSELLIRKRSTLTVDLSNGHPLIVRVAGNLKFGNHTETQVIGGDASGILFMVDGRHAWLFRDGIHYGTFIAPNGRVRIDVGVELTGAAMGADVTLNKRASVDWVPYAYLIP